MDHKKHDTFSIVSQIPIVGKKISTIFILAEILEWEAR